MQVYAVQYSTVWAGVIPTGQSNISVVQAAAGADIKSSQARCHWGSGSVVMIELLNSAV